MNKYRCELLSCTVQFDEGMHLFTRVREYTITRSSDCLELSALIPLTDTWSSCTVSYRDEGSEGPAICLQLWRWPLAVLWHEGHQRPQPVRHGLRACLVEVQEQLRVGGRPGSPAAVGAPGGVDQHYADVQVLHSLLERHWKGPRPELAHYVRCHLQRPCQCGGGNLMPAEPEGANQGQSPVGLMWSHRWRLLPVLA